jgi:hypothetical protein
MNVFRTCLGRVDSSRILIFETDGNCWELKVWRGTASRAEGKLCVLTYMKYSWKFLRLNLPSFQNVKIRVIFKKVTRPITRLDGKRRIRCRGRGHWQLLGTTISNNKKVQKRKIWFEKLFVRRPVLWLKNIFAKKSASTLAFLTQKQCWILRKVDRNKGFKEKRHFFAESWWKSQKIVIITSTLGRVLAIYHDESRTKRRSGVRFEDLRPGDHWGGRSDYTGWRSSNDWPKNAEIDFVQYGNIHNRTAERNTTSLPVN